MDKKKLEQRLTALKGHIGFYYKNLVTGETYQYHSEDAFEAASLPKLALLLEVKQLFDTTEAVRVLNDFDRVCEETARMQAKRHLGKFSPNETRGFILLETTKPVCFNWWVNDNPEGFSSEDTKKKRDFIKQGWKFNYVELGKFEVQINARGDLRKDTLFWLYAYSPSYDLKQKQQG